MVKKSSCFVSPVIKNLPTILYLPNELFFNTLYCFRRNSQAGCEASEWKNYRCLVQVVRGPEQIMDWLISRKWTWFN